jgi:hypothetical protein
MSHPFPAVCVTDGFLNTDQVAETYEVLSRVRIPPGAVYVSRQEVESGRFQGLADKLPEEAARLVQPYCKQLMNRMLSLGLAEFDGFEVWRNHTLEYPEKVALHFDNDEVLRSITREIVTPLVGSIMYLGPGNIESGGGTFFCLDQSKVQLHKDLLFQSLPWKDVHAALGASSVIVPFRPGRLVVFDGALAHCVVPFLKTVDSQPRVALLVNAWAKRIMARP